MGVQDYKLNPDENTTISGINVAEGCPPSGINNAIRQLMADIKADSEEQNANVMTGASASADGASGLVTQPKAGDEAKALLGNGTWSDTVPKAEQAQKALALYDAAGNQVDLSALAQMLAKYLPLTGGTLTGGLAVTGGVQTVGDIFSSNGNLNTRGFLFSGDPTSGNINFIDANYPTGIYLSSEDFRNSQWARILTNLQTATMNVLSAEIVHGVYAASSAGNSIQLPGWGSWGYFMGGAGPYMQASSASGGTVLSLPNAPVYLLAVRFG